MEMSLQERIKKLDEYHPDISYKDGYLVIKIHFKPKWTIIEPENDTIAHRVDNNIQGLHWFAAKIEDSDEEFDLIDEIISTNLEMEKKLLLYQVKVKDLQRLFLSDIAYEKLMTLEFSFHDATKRRKKISKKSNASSIIDETIDGSNINSVENNEVSEQCSEIISDIDKKISEAIE